MPPSWLCVTQRSSMCKVYTTSPSISIHCSQEHSTLRAGGHHVQDGAALSIAPAVTADGHACAVGPLVPFLQLLLYALLCCIQARSAQGVVNHGLVGGRRQVLTAVGSSNESKGNYHGMSGKKGLQTPVAAAVHSWKCGAMQCNA